MLSSSECDAGAAREMRTGPWRRPVRRIKITELPSRAGGFAPLRSEFELQSELHLPRRTRIAGWETSVGDYPKRRAPDLGRSSGLAKVGVVEKIKDFPAEFNVLLLTDLGAFNNRKVRVVESRTSYRVSAKVAEVINGLAADERYGQNRHRAGWT